MSNYVVLSPVHSHWLFSLDFHHFEINALVQINRTRLSNMPIAKLPTLDLVVFQYVISWQSNFECFDGFDILEVWYSL